MVADPLAGRLQRESGAWRAATRTRSVEPIEQLTSRHDTTRALGLGLGGFSETTIVGIRHLGGSFEFTELLRTGLRFGTRRQFQLALSAQDFSKCWAEPAQRGDTGLSGAWHFR